ncbi:hypothetical protein BC629DRAFT_846782 [Irpex lacteus]|nr:hypothetical protein BC629DRAFT_846782 [Irpex lacteus]
MPNGSMRFSLSELIWKAPGADRFLAFVPMQLLKPPGKNGEERFETGVTQRELVKRPNQRREIFFLHNHAWHYYGEYECMGTVSLTAKEVEEIGSAALVAYIEKRTLLEPQRARPGAADRIHNMYVEGKLKVQCFAFKRQSYNEPLNKLLTSKETPQSRSSQRVRANADSTPTPDNLYFVL